MPQRTASKRASGKRSAPALLARCAGTPGKAPATSRKRSICARAKASSASSAVARWLITPTTRSRGAGERLLGRHPPAPHARVHLEVDASALGHLGRDERRPRARASRAIASSPGASGPMTRIRAVGKLSRSSSPSRAVATQSAAAPPSSAARGDVDRPVPVGVRLDDRPELGRRGVSRSSAALRRSAPRSIGRSASVSPGAGRARAPRPRRGRSARRRRARSAATLRGDARRRRRRRPRRGSRLHALGEEGGDDAGEHVAGAGRRQPRAPEVDDDGRPRPGAATSVSAPLRSTTAPVSSAPAWTASSRLALTQAEGRPSSRAELARVRRQHRRRVAREDPVEVAGQRPEPVGVEDDRHVEPVEQEARRARASRPCGRAPGRARPRRRARRPRGPRRPPPAS